MSSDGSGMLGVTNHKGQLLKGLGKKCHQGIVAVDGSVVPLALGANPFATITALAERSVEEVANEFGIVIDYQTRNGKELRFQAPASNATFWYLIDFDRGPKPIQTFRPSCSYSGA